MRYPLEDGWSLWPVALLRGAGLPFRMLTEALADPALARQTASHPGLREAIAWQNPSALTHGIDRLARPGPLRAKDRRALRTLIRYLQRYAAKNDTIGFFGPLGWAGLSDGRGQFIPAETLTAAWLLRFEPWAVDLLQRSCGESMRDAPVRLPGHLRLETDHLTGPSGRRIPLAPDEVALVRAADGRPAHALLAQTPAAPETLNRLVAQGLLQRHPDVSVASGISHISDPAIARIETIRRDLEHAATGGTGVAEGLKALNAAFSAQTGRPAQRFGGEAYAGRTIVYLDATRGGALQIGAACLAPVTPALSALAQVARGYTFRIARRAVAALRALFRRDGRAAIPLPEFWQMTEPLLTVWEPDPIKRVADALRQDWVSLFGDRTVVETNDLHEILLPKWRAPCPGWPGARHHSPDLMWADGDADRVLDGRALPILAEFHPGVSTFTTLSVLGLCPDRALLQRLWAEDFPDPLVSPIAHERFARSTQDARLAGAHFHIDTGRGYVSDMAQATTLRAADFNVFETDGILWAGHLHRNLRFDLIEMFERRLKLRAAVAFPIGPGAAGPRLCIGRTVVRRASWRGMPPALPRDRFRPGPRATLRRWMEDTGLPERVFAHIPGETKPVFVDRNSELSLDMVLSMIHKQGEITLTEMLPDGDQLWLRDADGARYTSELRLCMTDPVPYDRRAVWATGAG
ncbi:MAG: lantibiotic dehydratase [Rhodobacter sp.]|nr:lantibiotic dehydratase [Rhodobacter sp.]